MRANGVRTWAVVSIAAVLACGLGACTHGARGPESGKGSQASEPRASVSPAATGERDGEAVVAYRAMWEDAAEASRTSDPKHPRLDDHAEKNALWLLQYVMRQARKSGVTMTGEVAVAPMVVKESPNRVVLRDCVDGSRWVQVKPGSAPDDMSGGRRHAEATVVRTAKGSWKVSDLYWEDIGTCVK